MQKIKVAVCHEFGAALPVEDVLIRPPEGSEVEVDISAVAICHSDISCSEDTWGGTLPAVYGHEAAGVITTVGPNAVSLAPGDSVIVTLVRACGNCQSCASGAPTQCETSYDGTKGSITTVDRAPPNQAMATAGIAEKVVVCQSQVARVDPATPKDAAALVACGGVTGMGTVVNAAGLRAGQDVVVIGAGGVGLNAIQGARIAGARRIVAVDISDEKLEIALSFGATDSILAPPKSPWDAAKDLLGGRGADAVIVTVGAIPAYDQALQYLGPHGKVIIVGMQHSGQISSFEPVNLADTGQNMIDSNMGDIVIQRDIPWLVDLYAQGRLKLEELISGRWPLEQFKEAIADIKTGSAQRNVILF
ncbi:MAG: zinc-binding dehydrogenase [Pseudomonadota bacterium]